MTTIINSTETWHIDTEPADSIIHSTSYYPAPGNVMWENYRITVTDPLGEKEEYYYYAGTGEYSWHVSPRDYVPYVDDANNNYARNVPRTFYYRDRSSSVEKVVKIIYPEGEQVEYAYDESTEDLLSIEDSNSHTNSFTYNTLGNIATHTDPKGNVTTIEYDLVNSIDPVRFINGLGTITNQFNDYHQVTLTNDRLGNETSFVYSSSTGLITSQTTTLANAPDITTNYYYDSDYFLTDIVSGGYTLANFTYDTIGSEKIGRIKTSTNATGLTLTYDYNSLNNVTKITYPDSKFTSYTYSDCCPHIKDSVTDRSGRTTEYTYDALKRLTDISNPETGLSSFVYDPNGNMTKFIDPNGKVTRYEYDLNNRLIKKTYDDDKFETYVYNTDGLMATFINARNITTYNLYDENHNLYSVDYSDSTAGVSYQYDNYNRVTQRQDGIGTYSFGYDANNNLTMTNGPWANDSITNQYDEIGRRLGLSIDGSLLYSNSYDGFSRLTDTQIGTATSTYSYIYTNANPLVQSLTRPNGSVTTYQYDSLNRLTTLSNQNSGSTVINQYSYVYSNDLRSSETVTNGNSIIFSNDVITYDYNAVNQLLASTNTNSNQSFTYDAAGNMTRGYTVDGYIFSASYDAENRLDTLEYTDVASVIHKTEYQYSGNSFLAIMKKYDAGTLTNETRFVRYGLLPLQERNSSNNVTREYAWGLNMGGGIGGLLNVEQSGQNYSYLYDGKGNVTAVIDSAEAVAATYTYDAFGNLMVKTGSLDQPFQFSTKRYDTQTGFSHYGYRFYSPALGRWITRDPLGEAGGMNLYGFALNNPINWADPYGDDPATIIAIGIGVVAVGTVAIGIYLWTQTPCFQKAWNASGYKPNESLEDMIKRENDFQNASSPTINAGRDMLDVYYRTNIIGFAGPSGPKGHPGPPPVPNP